MTKRAEFTTATKLKATMRYLTCPGVYELRIVCGKPLSEGAEWDHIKRCEIEPDNSPENARPLCRNCHLAKSAMDAKQAAKGRRLRGENKPKRKAKIQSRNTLSKEERDKARQWKQKVSG
jgi:hypothetical protein